MEKQCYCRGTRCRPMSISATGSTGHRCLGGNTFAYMLRFNALKAAHEREIKMPRAVFLCFVHIHIPPVSGAEAEQTYVVTAQYFKKYCRYFLSCSSDSSFLELLKHTHTNTHKKNVLLHKSKGKGMCVCVCAREREGGERGIERERGPIPRPPHPSSRFIHIHTLSF